MAGLAGHPPPFSGGTGAGVWSEESDASPERGITFQGWPTTASPTLKKTNSRSNLLPNDLIGGLDLEHSSLGDQRTVPQEVTKRRCLQAPDSSLFLCTPPGSSLEGEKGGGKETLYGGSRLMGPPGILPSKSPPRPEGMKEGEHSAATPHPVPHHWKTPTTPHPKGERRPKVFRGKHFTNGDSWSVHRLEWEHSG